MACLIVAFDLWEYTKKQINQKSRKKKQKKYAFFIEK